MIPILHTGKDDKLISGLISRGLPDFGDAEATVGRIVTDVRKRGDAALFEYTEKFDGHVLNPKDIKVSREEMKTARKEVDSELMGVIERAAARISAFHEKQKQRSWFETTENGEMLGQIIRPLESAGVYVPGGKAAYPSSVLMNVIPAKIAGVKNIIMSTPANKYGEINPLVLAAAETAGVSAVYKIGGAQAVAAMAFGTASVPKADKIVGPGNIYVALAKRAVYGYADIDSIAGPSEILIIADETANAAFVAADMLSQAEHDELASAILLTDSETLAKQVQSELLKQTPVLERKDIINASLNNHGAAIVVKTLEEAMEISNRIAPEHLEICTRAPFSLLPLVKNAGAVFMGHYSPEPLGDYMAGTNHVLPTSGTARFFSPLSVDDFVKKSSLISFDKKALSELKGDIIRFACAEGLTAHANAIRVRFMEEP